MVARSRVFGRIHLARRCVGKRNLRAGSALSLSLCHRVGHFAGKRRGVGRCSIALLCLVCRSVLARWRLVRGYRGFVRSVWMRRLSRGRGWKRVRIGGVRGRSAGRATCAGIHRAWIMSVFWSPQPSILLSAPCSRIDGPLISDSHGCTHQKSK